MKVWQIKIIVRNSYPYTNDTYDEIIREYYEKEQQAHERFMEIMATPFMFGGEVRELSMKEIKKIKEVVLNGK